MPEKFPEDLIRKASRVVLHAAERRKESLFKKLTAQNAEKMAQLVQEKPIFFEEQEDAPREIILDEEIADVLPPEFFENPTKWIESQVMVKRGDERFLPSGESIEELWTSPYDVTKVKQFSVNLPDGTKREMVSKRIAPRQLEEIATARKAFEAGIPTPKVLGEIVDRGNVYAFFEHLPGINLNAAIERLCKRFNRPLGFDTAIVLVTATNEYDFLRNLQRDFPFISERADRKLWKIWKKGRPLFVRNELIWCLKMPTVFSHTELEEYSKRITRILKEQFSEDDVRDVLKYIGFNNFEEFFSAIPLAVGKDGPLRSVKFLDYLDSFRPQIEINRLREKMESVIGTDVFGFDYLEEIRKLQTLCRRKRIIHKDFEPRNLMILWDFEKDRPLPRKKDEPKLYVIDWEPAPKTPKKYVIDWEPAPKTPKK